MIYKHPGTVLKGKFIPDNRGAFIMDFQRNEGRRMTVAVARETRDRSSPQNKYYWGVVIKMLSDWAGYEPEEMHEALKDRFLAMPDARTGLRVSHSTAKMTTEKFSEYIEAVKRFAAENGVNIPEPGQTE